MPYMSGYELATALVGDEQTRHIPVILLTSDPEGEVRARELGLAAFLAKPVRAEHLLGTVARFAPGSRCGLTQSATAEYGFSYLSGGRDGD
jgi:chemosensory pili system protein ChpA (sensor histidine kinase/response regulator)